MNSQNTSNGREFKAEMLNMSLRDIAVRLSGEVSGNQVKAPAPGHSNIDRSMTVTPTRGAPDGFLVHVFGRGEDLESKDYVRDRLGLPAWGPGNGDSGNPDCRHNKFGYPSKIWLYHDAAGNVVGAAARYEVPATKDTPADKTVLPWTLKAGGEWKCKAMDKPRPLYRLHELVKRAGDPVLVVEGEKSADKAAQLFPGHAATTSPGGCLAARFANWSHCRGRHVTIWPDHDDAGIKYAKAVASLATEAGALSVRIVEIPADWPAAWDLADELPEGVTDETLNSMLVAARPWGEATPSQTPVGADWAEPDMTIVEALKKTTPPVPLAAFEHLSGWIEGSARGAGASACYVALGVLVAVAGLIGGRRWVSPWHPWVEPAILWGGFVAPPSVNKSPALDPIQGAIKAVEKEINWDWEQRKQSYDDALELAHAAQQAWVKMVAKALTKGDPSPPRPDEAREPKPVHRRQLWTVDTTVESVSRILSRNENNGRLIGVHDELASWFGSHDRYSGAGGDRADWLKAFGGRSHRVDRAGWSLDIPSWGVSLIGIIQPEKLAECLLRGANDGLASRFLFVSPPPIPPKAPGYVPPLTPLTDAFRRLASLEVTEEPVILPLEAGAALATFTEWYEGAHHEAEKRATGVLTEVLAKMRGIALRLALILEYLWWASAPLPRDEPTVVSARAIGWALILIDDWLTPHIESVFSEAAVEANDTNAARLAKWILRDRPEEFNSSSVRRTLRSVHHIRDADDMDAACDALVEARWIRRVGGGERNRPRKDFVVNPALCLKAHE